MILDMINLTKLRRAVLYLLLLLAVFFVQEVILSHVKILGVRPMILPLAVVAIGFWAGGVWGGIFGIVAGLFADMSMDTASVVMTIIFPAIGFFSGALPMFFMSRRFSSFFFLSVAALVVTAGLQMFRFLVFSDTASLPVLLTGLFQVLWSIPFIFALYHPSRAVSRLYLSR